MPNNRITKNSLASWTTKKPSLGTALLTPQGEEPRKSCLTEVHLIAHEWSRLNVNIAALSEVRFPGEGVSKSMAPDTSSSGHGNLQERAAFKASVSWSAPPSPPGWKICQLVIRTTWCLCTFVIYSHNKYAYIHIYMSMQHHNDTIIDRHTMIKSQEQTTHARNTQEDFFITYFTSHLYL